MKKLTIIILIKLCKLKETISFNFKINKLTNIRKIFLNGITGWNYLNY